MTLGTPIFVKIMTKNAMTPSSGELKVPLEESSLLVPRARYTCIQCIHVHKIHTSTKFIIVYTYTHDLCIHHVH